VAGDNRRLQGVNAARSTEFMSSRERLYPAPDPPRWGGAEPLSPVFVNNPLSLRSFFCLVIRPDSAPPGLAERQTYNLGPQLR
jgi:hypothetical protein